MHNNNLRRQNSCIGRLPDLKSRHRGPTAREHLWLAGWARAASNLEQLLDS